MLDLQVFIWISLVGTTPGMRLTRKCLAGFLGILGAFVVLMGVVVFIEMFKLTPHKGFFKATVILIPFLIYYFWHFTSRKPKKS